MDDVGFIKIIQETIRNDYCVDESRMLFAGYSFGGVLAWHIASLAEDGLGFATIYTAATVPFLGFGLPPEEVNYSLFDVIGNEDKLMPPKEMFGTGPHNSVQNKGGWYKPIKTDLLNEYAEVMDCGDESEWTPMRNGMNLTVTKNLQCFERQCQNGKAIVRCNGDFGHTPNFASYMDQGWMVYDFMKAHPRT